MITKIEIEETIKVLKECELLEIEFTSNRKSNFDPAPQGVCFYAKSLQCIDEDIRRKIQVVTEEIKVTENTIIIKNDYTTEFEKTTKKCDIVTKIIALDQISNITIV